MQDVTVEQLRDYVQRAVLPSGKSVAEALEFLGMVFSSEFGEYELTPINSSTFATTCGDGVHYGSLKLDDATPIVMTVPMMCDPEDEGNRVVGETLHEFLCLGCISGWFALEQNVYGPVEDVVEYQSKRRDDGESYEEEALEAMREHFNLKLWDDIAGRLAELQDKYRDRIEVALFPWDEE